MVIHMKNMILGTDWWSDCDDAVAVRVLTRAVKAGDVNLLGIIINACMADSVASLSGFLKWEGLDNVQIGIDKAATDYPGKLSYQKRLAATLNPAGSNEDAACGVRLYRKLLAASNEPVEIMEIGFLQVMAALLESEGDEISEKSGLELVREKVSRIWVMAGKWDGQGEKEHNFCLNARSCKAAEVFCRLCPVPVTFLGWEIGYDVITGSSLAENDVLHQILIDHGSAMGRYSWDPMLVLLAVIGDEENAGYHTVSGTARVDALTGANYFTEDPKGLHKYVIKKYENEYYRKAIDDRL